MSIFFFLSGECLNFVGLYKRIPNFTAMKIQLYSRISDTQRRFGYIAMSSVITLALVLSCIPSLSPYLGFLGSAQMLGLGLLTASLVGTPYKKTNSKLSKQLLQYSIIGLGFGMNLDAALASGAGGMSATIVSVFGTLALGMLLGVKLLGLERNISYLISSGTAICGGSAIAAVGPAIEADDRDMSVALGTIFILNAIALFIFPPIGHLLEMTQQQFGTWAAIAIHDTSSVVGAGATYGEEALQTATMIKLTRALWIIPVALLSAVLFKGKGKRIKLPWFILYFVLAMVASTYITVPWFAELGDWISFVAKRGMMLAMFFIGASLSLDTIRSIGPRSLVLALALWVIISISSLALVVNLP